jgi:hypothetical protein
LVKDHVVELVGVVGAVGNDLPEARPATRPHAGAMSFCWPGPISNRTGRPRASTITWSLVPKPPRERPRAWARNPPLWMARPSGRRLYRMSVFKRGRNGP